MLNSLLRRTRRSVAERLRGPEERELEALRRFHPTETVFFGKRCVVPDPGRFPASEIFETRVDRFTCATTTPRIIDCDVNNGMSVFVFKTRHADAVLSAFQPGPPWSLASEKRDGPTVSASAVRLRDRLATRVHNSASGVESFGSSPPFLETRPGTGCDLSRSISSSQPSPS